MTTVPPPLDAKAMGRHASSAAKVLKALSNTHRLLILCVLCEGELSVSELNSRVRLSQSALSQHLAVLRRERLVSTRRLAQTIYYQAAPGIALDVVQLLHDHYCEVSADGLTGPPAGRSRSPARRVTQAKPK